MSDPKDQNHNKRSRKHSGETGLDLAEYRLVPVDEIEQVPEKKFDLFELLRKGWDNRKTFYWTIGIFVIIGLIVALTSPLEYETDVTLMPELPDQSASGGAAGLLQKYGGLIGLSGTDLSGNVSTINVILYPNIIQSTPFLLDLMNQKIHSAKYDTTVTVYHYFQDVNSSGSLNLLGLIQKYTIGLPSLIFKSFSKNKPESITPVDTSSIIAVTKDQKAILKNLSNSITTSLDNQTGIVSITVDMPEPRLSAVMANKTIELLKKYVSDYRTQKASRDYKFIEQQYADAAARFKSIQDSLAIYQDQNKNLTSALAQTKQQRLQDRYNLEFNVYNNLAQQKEQARIQLQKDTPVFKVLEPAKVPLKRTSPKRTLMMIIAIFLGFVFSIIVLIVKNIYSEYRPYFNDLMDSKHE